MENQVFPRPEFQGLYSRIIRANSFHERDWLNEHACRSRHAKRRHEDKRPDRHNIRLAFAHDADRIIHCRAYSRYIDKTQVFFLVENDHITHRVLHVQFVSKIARTISRCLRLNEDLTEAIALAHDLGHAPFGHAGEEFLAKILQEKEPGTFVHNAQSVRVLEVLEQNGRGLNLTLQVLDGVLGHNGELLLQELRPADGLNWPTFDRNRERCFLVEVYPSTLEGCVVRVADVISYVGRDIEDAIEVKLISRDELPECATGLLGATNQEIINNLVMDVIHHSVDKGAVCFSERVFNAMKCLMDFNYERIYRAEAIKQEKQRLAKVFRELFDSYMDDLAQGCAASPITKHRNAYGSEYADTNCHARIIADFMAGMTDDYLVDQYRQRFVPQSLGYRLGSPGAKRATGIDPV